MNKKKGKSQIYRKDLDFKREKKMTIFDKARNFIQKNNKRIKKLEDTKYIQATLEDMKAFEVEIKNLKSKNRKWKEILSYENK